MTAVSHLPLKYLEIYGSSNFNPNLDALPATLQHLRLMGNGMAHWTLFHHLSCNSTLVSESLNCPLDHLLPSPTCLSQQRDDHFAHPLPAITKLKIPIEYNLPLQLNAKPLLTHLQLSCSCSQPLGNLPSSLTHLSFGETFNDMIHELSDNISHLTFGAYFDQDVDSLPSSVTCEPR